MQRKEDNITHQIQLLSRFFNLIAETKLLCLPSPNPQSYLNKFIKLKHTKLTT